MNRTLVNLLLFILLLSSSPILLGQGTEKISNGTIDNSIDWTLIGSGFSIGNGIASFDGASNSTLRQACADMVSAIEDSKTYILQFDITTSDDEDCAWLRIYSSDNAIMYKAFDAYYEGSHSVIFTSPASGNDGGIGFYGTTVSDAFDIDNISLIELPPLTGGPYYVATEAGGGNDANDGSIGSPWASWQRAINAATPGDTVYFRGGVYYKQPREDWTINPSQDLGVNGERGNPISYMGYPPDIANGDSVIFDCSLMYIPQPDNAGIEALPPTASPISVSGFACAANHIVFKDLTFRNIYQKRRYIQTTGFNLSWANNIRVENCVLYNCSGHGFYYDPWWSSDGIDSSIFLNNDAYNCCDSFAINVANYRDLPHAPQAGTWANGFMIITINRPNEDTNSYIQFLNNRAWHNADEGVNLSSTGTIYAQGNWSFANGYHLAHDVYDHVTSGNGWKVNAGWYDMLDSNDVQYYFYNNLGAYNIGYGYGENNNGRLQRNREVYNNTMYKNSYGFQVLNPHGADSAGLHTNRYVNNIAYDNRQFELTPNAQNYMYESTTNSWDDPPNATLADDDFVLADSSDAVSAMKGTRNADGSLPDIEFLNLAEGSDLIDVGTYVGLDTVGSAPDLGYHEFGTVTPVIPITSSFELQDTAIWNSPVDVIYTGNASASATYYWDFGCASVVSGSGQGPYVLQWSTAGCDTVSLYVEESNTGSDTTASEIYILSDTLSSSFVMYLHLDTLRCGSLTDTLCPGTAVEIIYTGNASDTATYFWDFGSATVISGSGQGPYLVNWTYSGSKEISLYVEEANVISDTTTNGTFILPVPIFNILPYPNDTVTINDTITLTADIVSDSYLWSTGETTPSILVYYNPALEGVQNYWLKVTDENGCSNSDTIIVWFDDMPVQITDLPGEIDFKAYPNPVKNHLNIELGITEPGQYILEVVNTMGLSVIRESRHFEPGAQKIQLNMSSHSPGIYILTVKSNNGMIGAMKIVK